MVVTRLPNPGDHELICDLLGRIDRGEMAHYVERSAAAAAGGTAHDETVRVIEVDQAVGVYRSFPWDDCFHVSISFSADLADPGVLAALGELAQRDLRANPGTHLKVWVNGANRAIIRFLIDRFAATVAWDGVELTLTGDALFGPGPVVAPQEPGATPAPPPPAPGQLVPEGCNPERLDAYLALLDRAFEGLAAPRAFSNDRARLAERFTELDRRGGFRAFWFEGELVALYYLDGDELEMLAVEPRHQRQGYGAAVFGYLVRHFFLERGQPALVLYCVRQNERARTFYEKCGMRVTGQAVCLTVTGEVRR